MRWGARASVYVYNTVMFARHQSLERITGRGAHRRRCRRQTTLTPNPSLPLRYYHRYPLRLPTLLIPLPLYTVAVYFLSIVFQALSFGMSIMHKTKVPRTKLTLPGRSTHLHLLIIIPTSLLTCDVYYILPYVFIQF